MFLSKAIICFVFNLLAMHYRAFIRYLRIVEQSFLIIWFIWFETQCAGKVYSRVDEVYGLSLELVGTVQVCQYQDVGCVLYWEVGTQRFLTHHLEPFQRILPTKQSFSHVPLSHKSSVTHWTNTYCLTVSIISKVCVNSTYKNNNNIAYHNLLRRKAW